jgi:DNA-binding transcriptional MerR regulator
MIESSCKEEVDMTIKEFSKLCDCNTQTLRYYDSIDLLKPARVDSFTGYRYYDEDQALDYIKIKNLQNAMFSIEEIKDLLKLSDDAIVKAFDKKIDEQKAKLETIIQIQQSYRNEYMKMKDMIEKTKSKLNECIGKYDAAKEYGISDDYYRSIVEDMNERFDNAMEEMGDAECGGKDKVEIKDGPAADPTKDPANKTVLEMHGWDFIAEVLEKLPTLDGDYILYFELDDEKWTYNDFCFVVLKIVQDKNKDNAYNFNCIRNKSEDGINHFSLLKK